MVKLKLGDTVSVKFKENSLVNVYEDLYDQILDFTIVGMTEEYFYLYIPPFSCLKDLIKVDVRNHSKMNLHKRYIDDEVLKITEHFIYKVKNILNGTCCKRCGDFCQYGAPAVEGGDFFCYSCTQNPYR